LVGVVTESAVDGVWEVTFKDSEGFEAAVAGRFPAGEEVFGWLVNADLGDGYAMQRCVDLPVPEPGQSMSLMVRGPHRERCRSIVTSERVTAFEPGHSAGLTNDLGCCERSAADQRK
jgi:hypothetical protein